MNLHMENAELALKPGQFLTLDDACGTEIRIENGSAWITEEGDSSDFTLAPGAAHTVMHQGRTVVQAMNAANITLVEDECARAANDCAETEGPVEASANQPWYAAGMNMVADWFARIEDDFERKAYAGHNELVPAYGPDEQLARYRLNAQLGYMESDPRYF